MKFQYLSNSFRLIVISFRIFSLLFESRSQLFNQFCIFRFNFDQLVVHLFFQKLVDTIDFFPKFQVNSRDLLLQHSKLTMFIVSRASFVGISIKYMDNVLLKTFVSIPNCKSFKLVHEISSKFAVSGFHFLHDHIVSVCNN